MYFIVFQYYLIIIIDHLSTCHSCY